MQVPFFSDDGEAPSTPKADALFIPRENPRALVICPTEQFSFGASVAKTSSLKDMSCVPENGKVIAQCRSVSFCNIYQRIVFPFITVSINFHPIP